tara:strand:+ start:763 stop:942 length:180 start_codon:yes stop_codon:yes gene_type:complete
MNWKDIMKNEKVEIDSELMHLPKFEKLKGMAMYDLLLRHYSAPELEDVIIEMMEKITNR